MNIEKTIGDEYQQTNYIPIISALDQSSSKSKLLFTAQCTLSTQLYK
jgi:hypothetical protein